MYDKVLSTCSPTDNATVAKPNIRYRACQARLLKPEPSTVQPASSTIRCGCKPQIQIPQLGYPNI